MLEITKRNLKIEEFRDDQECQLATLSVVLTIAASAKYVGARFDQLTDDELYLWLEYDRFYAIIFDKACAARLFPKQLQHKMTNMLRAESPLYYLYQYLNDSKRAQLPTRPLTTKKQESAYKYDQSIGGKAAGWRAPTTYELTKNL